ncbi:MAG: acyl-CoA dehydrogenase family protein [Nitrospiria bacterium]
MEIHLSEAQALLQATVRDFSLREIAPGARLRDEHCAFPHDIIPKMAALGLFGVTIPETYGGAGLNALALAVIIEEIAAVDGAVALITASHNSLCTAHLFRFGSKTQRQKYVTPLARGEVLGAWGLTEPASGSDAAALETTAVLSGDAWVINGGKLFITQGSTAGVYVIMAKTNPDRGKKGISAFIVEKGTPGLVVGPAEKKLGVRASDTAALHFEHLRIPKENLVGERNRGYEDALRILDGGRIGIGAMAVGLARGAMERSLRYAVARRQFGNKIGTFQAIQTKLSDMATEIEAARLLVYRAAWLKDHQQSYVTAASEAKLFASEVAHRATSQAVRIHGGFGFMQEAEVERLYRDAKLCEIGEGTSEIQRAIIAKTLLQ